MCLSSCLLLANVSFVCGKEKKRRFAIEARKVVKKNARHFIDR